MSRKPAASDALKITDQYRRRPNGMVCELRAGEAKLAIHTWQLEDPASPGWRVEAHSGSGSNEVVIGRTAVTRAEALRDVGDAWCAERITPSFDWEGIGKLLASVRVV
jgi:hypothetical protein